MQLVSGVAQTHMHVSDGSQVSECRRAAQKLAAAWGLGETGTGRVGIVATELATNLVRHGGGGELLLQPLDQGGHAEVELLAIDRGAGMEIERCMRDGFSTGGTPGTGLGAVRRLSSLFGVYSRPERGTVVLSRVSRSDAGSEDPLALQFGAICVPVQGEVECGDTWCIAADEARMASLVVDGLGHGPLAAVAAQAAAEAFRENPLTAPADTMRHLHQRLTGTRGAAAACAVLDAHDSRLTYAGVGNITGVLLHDQARKGLTSHNGTLGVSLLRSQQFDYPWPASSLLVMHSDGVSARWNLSNYPGLFALHPALIAAVLYQDHARQRDDATIVVTSRLQ